MAGEHFERLGPRAGKHERETAIVERPDLVVLATENPFRERFFRYLIDDPIESPIPVYTVGAGEEPHYFDPVSVAAHKVFTARDRLTTVGFLPLANPNTVVHIFGVDGMTYRLTQTAAGDPIMICEGKPPTLDYVQRAFYSMHETYERFGLYPEYMIRSGSVRMTNGTERPIGTAHSATVLLDPDKVLALSTDKGMNGYIERIQVMHAYASGLDSPDTSVTPKKYAAGLQFEALFTGGAVIAVDDTPTTRLSHEQLSRARFIAGVGVSHRIVSSLSANPLERIAQWNQNLMLISLMRQMAPG